MAFSPFLEGIVLQPRGQTFHELSQHRLIASISRDDLTGPEVWVHDEGDEAMASGEVEKMARTMGKSLTIDLRPVIKTLGLKHVIEQVGLKQVIGEVGLKQVIDDVGIRKVIDEIGVDQFLANLSPAQRRELKRLME